MVTEVMDLVSDGPDCGGNVVILAHGAGAGMETDFMNTFATEIAELGWRVVRFEFPYMAERRRTGKRRPPDREPVLRQCWLNVVESQNAQKLVVGGKSMGGRIASMIADEVNAAGVVCLGYPFHPTGKPDKLRIEHLRSIHTPTLIVQGERDPFGREEEVLRYKLSTKVKLHFLPDGDHSYQPRKTSNHSLADNLAEAVDVIAKFLRAR